MTFFGSKHAPCPYCYTLIDPSKPWYRCSGVAAPGRPECSLQEDERRVALLDDSRPVRASFEPNGEKGSDGRPVCPTCKGGTGTRVCLNCHSPLPTEFGENSPLFGMVGVRGSGKTVMLTVLSGEVQTTMARRLNAVIDPIGDSPFLVSLKKKRQEFDAGKARLPSQTSTDAAATRYPAVFSLTSTVQGRYGVKRKVSTVFSFLDTAGENLGGAERARDVHYLAAASGLVLLLNPFAFSANKLKGEQRGLDPGDFATEPIAVLSNISEALREHEHLKPGKKIRKPFAVVLGMIDAFFDEIEPDSRIRLASPTGPYYDELDGKVVHDYVAALIAKWGGDNILRHLDERYETYRLFAISALGAEPNYSTRITSSRGIQPHRVSEPLLWLMACHGLVTIKKA